MLPHNSTLGIHFVGNIGFSTVISFFTSNGSFDDVVISMGIGNRIENAVSTIMGVL